MSNRRCYYWKIWSSKIIRWTAFSKTYECIDNTTNEHVYIKVIKNEKDYVEQSLDEIKVLNILIQMIQSVNFCYKKHLFLITELLYENLYYFICLL